MEKENIKLKEDVNNLKSTVMFLNHIRVQKDCVINGISADEETKPIDVVVAVANKIDADIGEDDVDEAYFLNKRNNSSNLKSVVFKFMSNRNKAKNDFVCKDTMDIFNHAKSLKSVGFRRVYTSGGNVYVNTDENSRQIQIKSMADVDDILKQPVSKGKHLRKWIEVAMMIMKMMLWMMRMKMDLCHQTKILFNINIRSFSDNFLK